jgi:hypothetical protein
MAVSTVWGDLLWCDGGWPGSCHEQELIELSGLGDVLDAGVVTLLDRGFGAWPSVASTGMRWRGLLYRVRDVYRAAGALVCLGRWFQRIPRDRASAGGG